MRVSFPFQTPVEIAAALPEVVAHLRAGKLIAGPTETVYGFGSTIDPSAIDRLVALKQRRSDQAFLLLISARGMIDQLGLTLGDAGERLARAFWPGPLTLVLRGDDRPRHPALIGNSGGTAIRLSSHLGMGALGQSLGAPIVSTSANRRALPPATSAAEIQEGWGAEIARGDLIALDGGPPQTGRPSTIVDCVGRYPRVLRVGAIDIEALRATVPGLSTGTED